MPEQPPKTKNEAREMIDEMTAEMERLNNLASERSRGGSPDDAKELSELVDEINAEIQEIERLIQSLPDETPQPEDEELSVDDLPPPTVENFSEITTIPADNEAEKAREKLREILPDLKSNSQK